jgi:hypothetical protein
VSWAEVVRITLAETRGCEKSGAMIVADLRGAGADGRTGRGRAISPPNGTGVRTTSSGSGVAGVSSGHSAKPEMIAASKRSAAASARWRVELLRL